MNGSCQPGSTVRAADVAERKLSLFRGILTPIKQPDLLTCSKDGPQGFDRAIVLLRPAGSVPATLRHAPNRYRLAGWHAVGAREGTQGCPSSLPQDAERGSGYINHARLWFAIDRVFLCLNAPFRPLRWERLFPVSFVLHYGELGSRTRHRGANLFRHTVATMMLRRCHTGHDRNGSEA